MMKNRGSCKSTFYAFSTVRDDVTSQKVSNTSLLFNSFFLKSTSKRLPKKRKCNLVQAEPSCAFQRHDLQRKGLRTDAPKHDSATTILLPALRSAILEHKQEAYPLFHFAQAASLESVMVVYSLYPKAIFSRTKSGYSPHHFAAGNRNDGVSRFLVLQHPTALAGKPSILQMLTERIHSVPLQQLLHISIPSRVVTRDTCDSDGNTLLHKACQSQTPSHTWALVLP
jgi:hypothetical protein